MTNIGRQRSIVALDVGREEEPLAVSVDGKTCGATELTLFVDAGRITESVILGKTPTAEVFVCFAMEVVGAGLGDDVEKAAGSATELGSEAVGDDLEFLDSFDRNSKVLGFEGAEILAEEIVGSVRTVDHEPVLIALLAAEPDGAAETGNDLGGGSQLGEVPVVASWKRQALETLGIDQL